MPGTEKIRRLQARLTHDPDRNEVGELLPATSAALQSEEPVEMLVQAFLRERILLAVGEPVVAEQGALLVFTSQKSMKAWNKEARPVPKNGQDAAMLAIALGCSRFLVDMRWVITRPAIEALAAGDTWLPPWKDTDLLAKIGLDAKILPGTNPLVIEVYSETREEAEAEIDRISKLARFGTAVGNAEFRPRRRSHA